MSNYSTAKTVASHEKLKSVSEWSTIKLAQKKKKKKKVFCFLAQKKQTKKTKHIDQCNQNQQISFT